MRTVGAKWRARMSSAPFSRTLRSLRAETARGAGLAGLAGALLIGGWLAWSLSSSVAVYEVTEKARVEARERVHPLSVLVTGRVVAVDTEVGAHVTAEQVLIELDCESERLDLKEGKARLAALSEQVDALEEQIDAERRVREAEQAATRSTAREAQARLDAARARAEHARAYAQQLGRTYQRGLTSTMDLDRAEADAKASDAEMQAQRYSEGRLRSEGGLRDRVHTAAIVQLERERVEIQGQIAVQRAANQRLEHAIELHQIRAPIDGRVGELVDLREGLVVTTGTTLGRVVPLGDLRVVAHFPVTAAGRIEVGQPSRLRFPGYAWTQYGTVPAHVAAVGNEPTEGRLRVELDLGAKGASRVPLEHGLPAFVEVEVERMTPLELLLRAAGKWVDAQQVVPSQRGI